MTRVETGESQSTDDQMCCEAAASDDSDLLFACTPVNQQIDEEFLYTPANDDCSRFYDELSTFTNTNGFSRDELTAVNTREPGLSPSICCTQSTSSIDDPLIQACQVQGPTESTTYTFSSDTCTSLVTTTTIYFDGGNEKARSEEQSQIMPED